jgi:hypothetical protein
MKNREKRIIEAEEIRLLDQKGRLRLSLATYGTDGLPQIDLYDEQHHQRLSLSLRADGSPIIAFLHEDGPTLLGLGAEADGQTGLEIRQPDGTLAVQIGIDINHDNLIEVRDSAGELQWSSLWRK